MSNKFTRKIIRSFMENCMKPKLIFKCSFGLLELLTIYQEWDHTE